MNFRVHFFLVTAGFLLFGWAEARSASLLPVSGTDRPNLAGAGASFAPSFSSDGRYVVFLSQAHNLVTNDTFTPYMDVFVRDLSNSNTVLVSVNTNGLGGGNGDSYSPSISSNGQFIAFVSTAGNLVNNDTNGAPDIFVRDLLSGVTKLVSADATGNVPPPALDVGRTQFHLSGNPQISADGRWVSFESLASLGTLPDLNYLSDIYVRDLRSNVTWLVSVNAASSGSGNGNSTSPSMGQDGRFIAFTSTSTNLARRATNEFGEIYIRDLQSGTTVWASTNAAQLFTGRYACCNPVLSSDGQSVVFSVVSADDPTAVRLVHHSLQTGASTVLTSNTAPALLVTARFIPCQLCSAIGYSEAVSPHFSQISADGGLVVAESMSNVFAWDLKHGSSEMISVNAGGTGPANQRSHTPVMTSDGQRIAFLSAASDLVAGASNGVSQVYLRDRSAGTTALVSAAMDGGPSSLEIAITLPAISPNGRQVAFECLASDLVPGDLNEEDDVFLRDVDAVTTEFVSQRHPNRVASTVPGPSRILGKSSNADGRYIAFAGLDLDFSPTDTNSGPDLIVRDLISGSTSVVILDYTGFFHPQYYVPKVVLGAALSADGRYILADGKESCLEEFSGYTCGHESLVRLDLQSGKLDLVSAAADGSDEMGSCSSPAFSSDGNLVAFQSDAPDLVAGSSVLSSNIFIRGIGLGTNYLVSTNAQGVGVGGVNPIFSPDDQWLIFSSAATDLTTNVNGGMTNLFALDLGAKTIRMVSVGPDGATATGYWRGAAFSADSRHVAFVCSSGSVWVYDFAGRTSILACVSCDQPSLSADGRWVAYEKLDTGHIRQIFAFDLQSGLTNLTSPNRFDTGGGNGDSTSPQFSWDGRYVVFESKASDLVVNDTNNASDIFVRDRLLKTTMAIGLNLGGNSTGNGPSTKPILTPDGRTVVFQSFASDLVSSDYNYRRDVFVLQLGGPDTDHDGMDDDWEMAYFGTLDRDGTGDFDGDGQTDLQEFQAGTDPTNGGSVFRTFTLASIGGGGTRVIWNASPGKKYQLQFRDELGVPGWQTLPTVVTANGTTASMTDNSTNNSRHRFYRVLLEP